LFFGFLVIALGGTPPTRIYAQCTYYSWRTEMQQLVSQYFDSTRNAPCSLVIGNGYPALNYCGADWRIGTAAIVKKLRETAAHYESAYPCKFKQKPETANLDLPAKSVERQPGSLLSAAERTRQHQFKASRVTSAGLVITGAGGEVDYLFISTVLRPSGGLNLMTSKSRSLRSRCQCTIGTAAILQTGTEHRVGVRGRGAMLGQRSASSVPVSWQRRGGFQFWRPRVGLVVSGAFVPACTH